MKYELIITRTQPPCGGKDPRTHEFRSVATDDPVAYVKQNEGELAHDVHMEVSDDGKGTITVEFKSGEQHVTYEFTEE